MLCRPHGEKKFGIYLTVPPQSLECGGHEENNRILQPRGLRHDARVRRQRKRRKHHLPLDGKENPD